MKVVFPEGRPDATGGGRTRTLTATLQVLQPSSGDLVDAGFVVVLCGVALAGFASTFDTWTFLVVGLLGVMFGIAAAHLARALRWPWITVVLLVLVEFFLLGSMLSQRDEALFGVLPTLDSLKALALVGVTGWKQLLTTLPPVDGGGAFLGLPYLLGLVAGAVGYGVARATVRRPFWALVPPAVLLVTVAVLGTIQAPFAAASGLLFAGVAFVWAALRQRQRRRLVGTGATNRTQAFVGAGMLVAALVAGLGLGTLLPGAGTERLVLRTYVQPPIDLDHYASPLVSFRQYSSEALQRFHGQHLLTVEGGEAGQLLRFGVLDDYHGLDWSATGGPSGVHTGFQRIGTQVPNSSRSGKRDLTVTVQPAYASDAGSLAMWVPSLGDTASVAFEGATAKGHEAAFRFNLSSMQGVVLDRLRAGDVVRLSTAPLPTTPGPDTAPGAAPAVSGEQVAFLTPAAQRWAGTTGSPWERLVAVANTLKAGAWSDGTLPGEAQYLPGHGQRRLTDFANAQQLVGSDEQYAAAFGLLANQLGYPARVVMGAAIPADGAVHGRDVTAWVEVHTASGWIAFPPASFMPDRSRRPATVPQTVAEDSAATNVPPPNPARAPGSFEDLADGQLSAGRIEAEPPGDQFLSRLLGILAVVGPPVGGVGLIVALILGAKALRSRRRRTRGVPAQQVTAGWRDVLDRARDMGIVVPAGGTRLEEARHIGSDAAVALAHRANALVLGPESPDAAGSAGFWTQIAGTKKAMLAALPWGKRVVARLNVRSLLPERFAAIEMPAVRLPRLRRP